MFIVQITFVNSTTKQLSLSTAKRFRCDKTNLVDTWAAKKLVQQQNLPTKTQSAYSYLASSLITLAIYQNNFLKK